MTIETMRWHEAVNVHYDYDFRRQSLLRLARPFVIGPRVLDMRCITGTFAVELALSGMKVVALDGYEGAVTRANALAASHGISTPIAFYWDLTGLTRRAGAEKFDTVVCLDVLNHVTDDRQTVADIASILKPGGRLILNAPAFPALLGKRDKSLGHLRRYSRGDLRALLERYGFTIEQMRFWNFTALPVYALIERFLQGRIPDAMRFGMMGRKDSFSNRMLTSWYTAVENRVCFPLGLSHFVIARRQSGC